MCGLSKLACSGERNLLFVCAAVGNDFRLVCRSKLPLFFYRGIEIDSMLDLGSKLTRIQRWGKKKMSFVNGIESGVV